MSYSSSFNGFNTSHKDNVVAIKEKSSPHVISITSGKGGVGKTLSTVNLAVAARKMGLDVLIFDADLGLANVDVLLDLKPKYNLRHVIDGQVGLGDIIIDGPLGIKIIPSGSGIASLTQLTFVQRQALIDEINKIPKNIDLMLIDTGAGISDQVIHFNASAGNVIVVTTPEPHAMTDAYAMIKVLKEYRNDISINLLVNQTKAAEEGLKIFERIAEVARRFLNTSIDYAGCVPMDPQVQKSVLQRKAASESSAHTIAGQAWNEIARKLINANNSRAMKHTAHKLWENLLFAETKSVSLNVGI